MTDSINWTRINNDTNGNPRYVCHWLAFSPAADTYDQALSMARKLGGKKFHNKQYGGGIVFQSYNIEGLASKIIESVENENK